MILQGYTELVLKIVITKDHSYFYTSTPTPFNF